MLHLIPPPLHRTGYRVAHQLRRQWLRVTKTEVHGCSVIACDQQQRVLLVRHSYGPRVWAFPGGGMKKGEDPLLAALREFAEELACTVADPVHLGTLEEEFHGARNVAHVFCGRIEGTPRPDMRELVEARFFTVGQLPENIARTVPRRLALMMRPKL